MKFSTSLCSLVPNTNCILLLGHQLLLLCCIEDKFGDLIWMQWYNYNSWTVVVINDADDTGYPKILSALAQKIAGRASQVSRSFNKIRYRRRS